MIFRIHLSIKHKDTARIQYLSIDSKILNAIQKVAGASLLELELPRRNWLPDIREAYEIGHPIFTEDFAEVMHKVLPDIGTKAIDKGLQLAGISSGTAALHMPLQLAGSSQGFLSVWGKSLREEDLPAFNVFASQVGSTLQSARLYDNERQQAVELERSNSLVNALSSVAAKVSTTNDPDEILDIVGKQFQKLGIESLVSLYKT